MKKTIKEVRDWLLENRIDEDGDLDIDGLNFSDFDGDIFISGMLVKNNLFQGNQTVVGTLVQSSNKVGGDLYQSIHSVRGDLTQIRSKVSGDYNCYANEVLGNIKESGAVKIDLQDLTLRELSELGYKVKVLKED